MANDKKHREENFNAKEMRLTKYGFYQETTDLPDNYAKYYFTPDHTEVSGDFYLLAKYIMSRNLQSYHTITHVQSLNPRTCVWKKHRACNEMRHFTAQYYEFLEAHGLTKYVFLDGADKIIILGKGLNMPITKLSIECVSVDGMPKENCSYVVYGYKTLPCIETLSETKVYMESITYEFFIEYAKFPDYLSITFNRNTININNIIKIIRDICEDYEKILRVELF